MSHALPAEAYRLTDAQREEAAKHLDLLPPIARKWGRMAPNKYTREDAYQDAFVGLARGLQAHREAAGDMRALLRKAAHTGARDGLRRADVVRVPSHVARTYDYRRSTQGPDEGWEYDVVAAPPVIDLDDEIDLAEAMRRLPARDRNIVEGRLSGVSYEVLGARHGLTPRTTAKYCQEAVKRLRGLLTAS